MEIVHYKYNDGREEAAEQSGIHSDENWWKGWLVAGLGALWPFDHEKDYPSKMIRPAKYTEHQQKRILASAITVTLVESMNAFDFNPM